MIEPKHVAAVLLAAGQSTRFGPKDKLAEPVDGVPIVLRTARRIVELNIAARIAVCRDDWRLAPDLARLGFDIRINRCPQRGLSSSLVLGIAGAARSAADAALVLLGDMPFVGIDHLREILVRFDPDTAPVVASSREGTAMPPALFARAHFARLLESRGDRGGRSLLHGAVLVAGDSFELKDIDRPSDMP